MFKRMMVVVCLLGVCFCGVSETSAATNVLLNPSFETGLNDWTDLYGSPAGISTVAQSGSYSAVKSITSVSTQDYWSQLYQEVAYSPTQPVYARFYVKTTFSPVSTAKAGVRLEFMNAVGSVIGSVESSMIGGNTNWRLLDLNSTGAPVGTVKARLSLFVWAAKGDTTALTGEAYFDNGYWIKAYQALVLSATLRNVGFENGLNDWDDQFGSLAVLSSAVFRTGLYSAQKNVTTVTGIDYWSQLFQEISFAAGQPVYARIYAKTVSSPLATAQAGVMLQFVGSDGSVLQTINSATIGGNTNWRLLDLNATAAPAGTVKARYFAYVWAAKGDAVSVGTKVYFDDAYLVKKYVALTPQTVLRNGGFENGLHDWLVLGLPSVIVTTAPYAGVYALSKTVTGVTTSDYWSQSYQTIACVAGKTVTAGAFVKNTTPAVALAKTGLMVEFLDASGQVLRKLTKEIGPQAVWKKLSIVQVAPTGTVNIRISVYLYAPKGNLDSLNTKAYFDQVTLSIV